MAQQSTVNELLPAIGAQVFVQFESIQVACIVRDAKNAYGRVRLQVEPLYGLGSQWVELSRILAPVGPVRMVCKNALTTL